MGNHCILLQTITERYSVLYITNTHLLRFFIDSSNFGIVIISSTCSFVVILLLIVFIVAFYIRRKRRNLSKTFVDEWEINRGDVMLLDKIGEGFFGVVRQGYLYHAESKETFRSELKCDDNDDENKTLVACKMLKGTVVSLASDCIYFM